VTSKERKVLAGKLTGRACTLDGQPAVVMGYLHTFALISQLQPGGKRMEYPWATVIETMKEDKNFDSTKGFRVGRTGLA
jgi:hypothetical protein